MAARENQGLQIALIIFVILTITFSVTTYLCFKNWKEQEAKAVNVQKEKEEAVVKKDTDDKEIADLKSVIGRSGDDVKTIHDDIIDKFTKDWAPLGLAAAPDTDKNLMKVIQTLNDTIVNKKLNVESREKDIAQLKQQIAGDAEKALAKLKEVEAARDAAVADLDKERAAYKAAVDALKQEKDQLVQDKTLKNSQMDELKAGYERKLIAMAAQLAEANKDVAKIKAELAKYFKLDPSSAGGYVTWINQRDNMAYINLGWEDGLHRRITFSVYPPGTTDVAKASPKGKIEVVNVTGPHLAEARIVENPTNNPLLPGDIIHTVGWHPGQHEHFGIAGFVDIDGNGLDQTKKLHDLILANGGIVDAEIIESKGSDGKTTIKINGTMTVNTRYLIMGELSADKPAAAERLSFSTTLINEAKRLNVEQIGLQKFLAMMGYTSHSAASGATSTTGAAPAGAAPAGAAGADDNGFRPRQPPARGKDDGAF